MGTGPQAGDGRTVRRVIVTRPAEASADLAADLAAHGIEALSAPMLTVEPVTPAAPFPDPVQAILVTSGNGAEGASRLTPRRDLPVLAVGEATAAAARAAGFAEVSTASGDATGLVERVAERCRPAEGPLVWVSGEAISTDLAAELAARGFQVERRIAYRTIQAERLPPGAGSALRDGAVEGVLFFSPRSAEAFARLVRRAGLEAACEPVAAYCMSDAIGRAASKLAWRTIHVAESPTKAALVEALLRAVGRDGPDGKAK